MILLSAIDQQQFKNSRASISLQLLLLLMLSVSRSEKTAELPRICRASIYTHTHRKRETWSFALPKEAFGPGQMALDS
jgi:hypothetical protein